MFDRVLATAMVAVLLAGHATAQDRAVPSSSPVDRSISQATPPANSEDDIVIEGYRLRKDRGTVARFPTAISTRDIARRYDHSERQAKCAARSKLSDLSWLRAVVDGEVNSPRHSFAQDRLTRIYATCGEGSATLNRTGAEATDAQVAIAFSGAQEGLSPNIEPFPLGHSIYDRGAYTIQAIKRFTPDLTLTTKQTLDPAVAARFDMRELPRNRFRLPVDYDYFRVAVCMVRLQPDLAVRLAKSDGTATTGDVQAALVDRARACVGGSRNLVVDPTQFRIYIADAVYRWAVAARNVGSLIPTDQG